MLIVMQFPIADMRQFVPDEKSQLLIDRFLTLDPGQNFLRGCGPIRIRRRGGVANWAGEDQFALATRGIRFPDSLGCRTGDSATWRAPGWHVAFRRVLSDGLLNSRFEIGLVPTAVDWVRAHSIEDLLAAALSIPVETSGSPDRQTPLGRAAGVLRNRYVASTTKGPPPSAALVRAGYPLVLMEAQRDERMIQARGRPVYNLPAEDVDLWHWRYDTAQQECRVWLLQPGKAADPAAVRSLRIHLLRLHIEMEGLRAVLNTLPMDELPVVAESPAGQRLQKYLAKQIELLSRTARNGQPQQEILDVAYHTEDLVQPGRRASVLAQLERARPVVIRRVEAATAPTKPAAVPARLKIAWLLPAPVDSDPLPAAGVDAREVEATLARSTYRDRLEFRPYPAARLDDLLAALLQYGAQVVHFSGHGQPDGALVFEGEGRDRVPVNAEALGAAFAAVRGQVRCVVLAACYSAQLADALLPKVDCVLGTEQGLNDDTALGFTKGFYLAVGEGKPLAAAYAAGMAQALVGEPDPARQPSMKARAGIEVSTVRLVGDL
jgi:hypothetical protein